MIVLLAEHRDRGLHEVEQLQHHGAHAGEEARAKVPFEDVGQRGRRQHRVALRLGIHLALVRRKHEVAAGGFEQFAISLQRPWVLVEVFVRRELQAVDEDAHDDRRAALACEAHERQVPLVQVAHCRHEGRAPLAGE